MFGVLLAAPIEAMEQLRVATFNTLAPIHKSTLSGGREGETESLWQPRGRAAVELIRRSLSADVICLQEFWFEPGWVSMFEDLDGYALHTARRRGVHAHDGSRRSDGVATLVSSRWTVETCAEVELDGGRVALVVAATAEALPRLVVANVHLPFPSDATARDDQAQHVTAVAQVVQSMCCDGTLGIVAGDFNCRDHEPAAQALERDGWTNCAKAYAAMSLSSGLGGVTDLGVTHRTHRGEDLQCDYVFCRDATRGAAPPGFFDAAGTTLSSVSRYSPLLNAPTSWDPQFDISDHLPVTADFVCASTGRPPSPIDDEEAWLPGAFPDTIC